MFVQTIITHQNGALPPATVSRITDTLGIGLAWQRRFSYLSNPTPGSGEANLEVWWADATAYPPDTPFSVTAEFVGGAGYLVDARLSAVQGQVDTSRFWDSNASVPAKITGTLTAPASPAISTSAPGSMLIAWLVTTDFGFLSPVIP